MDKRACFLPRSQVFFPGTECALVRCMSKRTAIFAAWSLALGAIALLLPPIAQPASYHAFADQRVIGGIPHFGDVVSNLAFFAVGVAGLCALLFGRTRSVFSHGSERVPYLVFFFGVALVGAGSAYYHWAPGNATLFWDRATMSLAFMALFAAVIADRVNTRFGVRYALPMLLLIGASSVLWWRYQVDLRFYFVLGQVWPITSILLIAFLLYPKGNYVSTRHVVLLALLYGSAVAFEASDTVIWRLSNHVISGHTLKHLAAAMSVGVVLPMLHRLAPPRSKKSLKERWPTRLALRRRAG